MNSYIQVFGYTENKVVHKVDMAVPQVVRMGIHPWLVDLFEPQPVCGGMPYGVPLMFTPLCRFSLAYTQENQGVVAMTHDGFVQSISGPTHSRDNGGMRMKLEQVELSFDQHDFDKHFMNYLHFRDNTRSSSGVNPGTTPNPRCLPATEHTQMQLMNQSLMYNDGRYPGHHFSGSMFEPRYFRCSLPVEIERVFELFSRFHPMVFGPVLRKVLCGEDVGNVKVDFIVDNQGTPIFSQMEFYAYHLRQLGAANIMRLNDAYWKSSGKYAKERDQIKASGLYGFRLNGTNYRLFVVVGARLSSPRTWRRNDFSVHQLECEHRGEMIASRIALWDLGRKQTRLLDSLSVHYDQTVGKHFRNMKDQLRSDGINVVDVLWHNRQGSIRNIDAVPDGILRRYRERRGPHNYP